MSGQKFMMMDDNIVKMKSILSVFHVSRFTSHANP